MPGTPRQERVKPMSNKLCIFLCMMIVGQSILVASSAGKQESGKEIVLETEIYRDYTSIASFITAGFDFFQASHSFEQRLNLQQAEAQKQTLDSVAYFKKYWPKESDACNQYAQDKEKEYVSIAAYLKLGLTYPQAKFALRKNLDVAQAINVIHDTSNESLDSDDFLYTRSGRPSNFASAISNKNTHIEDNWTCCDYIHEYIVPCLPNYCHGYFDCGHRTR